MSNLTFVAIARIGSTEYDTLTGAVAAVPTGTQTTIEILVDFNQSIPVYIPSNKDIILDLAGYDITFTTGLITNSVNLEVTSSKDGGSMYSQHTEKVCIANNGTTVITSGEITGERTNAIRNNENGTITINGGTINGNGSNMPTIVNFANGTVNLAGGTVTGNPILCRIMSNDLCCNIVINVIYS